MSYTENALVIHRVGGLEAHKKGSPHRREVIHRVGGLEVCQCRRYQPRGVIHRAGGIETTIWIKSLTQ